LGLAGGVETPFLPIAAALENRDLRCEMNGNGRDQLALTIRNTSAAPVAFAVPAGLIAAGPKGENKMAILRGASATIPPQGFVDIALPAAALSSKSTCAAQPFTPTATTEPRLAGLLKFLADQPDAPKATAQLAVLCLLEDISFPQWVRFLATPATSAPAESHPTPNEVTQAIDVLGILRTIAPKQTFALAADPELKLRALRNPSCRAKAMQIYGLDLGDGAVPPDLGQLLHTKPNDNCPICRQRALMQRPASDL
jgi:hypothetical protein